VGGRPSDGLRSYGTGGKARVRRLYTRFSIRFNKGLIVAILATALLWAGIIAATWQLL
jgi:hypothetical protein